MNGLFAFARTGDDEEILTVVNCGDHAEELTLSDSYRDLLQDRSYRGTIAVASGERLLLQRACDRKDQQDNT